MATFEEFKEDIPLLVEAGLIAIKQGDEESAKKLFNAVGVLDPDNTIVKLGYGLIALHKMDIKNSVKLFKEVIAIEPENDRAKAFLGFAYTVSTLQEGSGDEKRENLKNGLALAQEVLEKSTSESTRQLAQSVVDWQKELQEKALTR